MFPHEMKDLNIQIANKQEELDNLKNIRRDAMLVMYKEGADTKGIAESWGLTEYQVITTVWRSIADDTLEIRPNPIRFNGER